MPAYSLGKGRREPSFIQSNSNPGVGEYITDGWVHESRIKRSMKVIMPKAQRDNLKDSHDNIGPGSYNPEKTKVNLSASIKGKTFQRLNTDIPSPGSYSPKLHFPSKQYSFGKSRKLNRKVEGPAPDTYNILSSHKNHGISFGHSSKIPIEINNFPGPGSYNNKGMQDISRRHLFKRQRKFIEDEFIESSQKQIPGPGSYEIEKFKDNYKGGKILQGNRFLKSSSNIPGPGKYNSTFFTKWEQPRAVIGKEDRVKSTGKKTQNPGPGAYEPSKTEAFQKNYGGVKFGQGKRDQECNQPKTPGPGAYESVCKSISRAVSISGKNLYSKQDSVPSPQKYCPEYNCTGKKFGTAVFGKEQRLKKVKTEGPGPGQYQCCVKSLVKTFYFTRTKNRQKLNMTVGPGQYRLKPFIGFVDGNRQQEKDILYV